MAPRLALVAGGTGGHLYPAIETARHWQRRTGQPALILTRHGADADKVRAAGLDPAPFLHVRPPRGKKDFPGYALALLQGALVARGVLRREGITHLLGFGNYISFAAMAMAPPGVTLGAHEANSVLGKANRQLLPRLKALYTSFETTLQQVPQAHRGKVMLSGFPVRSVGEMTRDAARRTLGLSLEGTVLLVMGGSLGARHLNETLLPLAGRLPATVYWVTGERDHAWVREQLGTVPGNVVLKTYEDDMPTAWRAADAALTRAGAGTLFEAWAAAVPLVMVPYPFAAEDHQTTNAREWERRFGCHWLPDGELAPERLEKMLVPLLENHDGCRDAVFGRMAAAPPADAAALMLDHFLGG